ncbi:hypothetical protein BH23BAC1_BH23BAC1_50310 [soil metagenome]
MIVVVNDANILIDIIKLQLLPQFFSLPMKFYTTSLILDELYDEQVELLNGYSDKGILNIVDFTAEELIEIALLQTEKRQLSDKDCSAIVCAKKVKGSLITSDNTLRKFALKKQIIVRGHLWVLDNLISETKISGSIAINKLAALCDTINPRLNLPKSECDSRIRYL